MNNNVEYQILFLATAMIGFTDMIKYLLLLMVWEIRVMTHYIHLSNSYIFFQIEGHVYYESTIWYFCNMLCSKSRFTSFCVRTTEYRAISKLTTHLTAVRTRFAHPAQHHNKNFMHANPLSRAYKKKMQFIIIKTI